MLRVGMDDIYMPNEGGYWSSVIFQQPGVWISFFFFWLPYWIYFPDVHFQIFLVGVLKFWKFIFISFQCVIVRQYFGFYEDAFTAVNTIIGLLIKKLKRFCI